LDLIFALASIVLSLITFPFSIVLVPSSWGESKTRKRPFVELEKRVVRETRPL